MYTCNKLVNGQHFCITVIQGKRFLGVKKLIEVNNYYEKFYLYFK